MCGFAAERQMKKIKIGFASIRQFWSSKQTVRKMKRLGTNMNKIFAKHVFLKNLHTEYTQNSHN